MSGSLDVAEAFDKLLDRLVDEVKRGRENEEAKNEAQQDARLALAANVRANADLDAAVAKLTKVEKIGEDLTKAFNAWQATDGSDPSARVNTFEDLKAAARKATQHFDEIPF